MESESVSVVLLVVVLLLVLILLVVTGAILVLLLVVLLVLVIHNNLPFGKILSLGSNILWHTKQNIYRKRREKSSPLDFLLTEGINCVFGFCRLFRGSRAASVFNKSCRNVEGFD